MKYSKKQLSELEYLITGAAIEVHKLLGPGLLESTYHKCMKIELGNKGLEFQTELTIPFTFKEVELKANLRCDIFVHEAIAVELKSTDGFAPIFDAQLLTYMRLLQCPKGLLFNFNCLNMVKNGKKSFVNDLYTNLM